MPFTTLALNGMLDSWVTAEGTLYVALIRTGGTEAVGVGSGGIAYARKAISFAAAASGNKPNSTDIVWDNGGATDWSSDIDKWKIYDALTSGNELANGNLTALRDMSIANATLTIATGDLDLDLT
jgi:hypothetical protein